MKSTFGCNGWRGMVLGAGLALIASVGVVPGMGTSEAWAQDSAASKQDAKAGEKATVIFRNGRTLEGVIVSETPASIRLKTEVAGIAFETDYPKSDILDIKRLGKADAPKADGSASPSDPADIIKPAPKPEIVDDGRDRVYWMDLTGKFGEEISQSPIRDCIKDAKNNRANTIVVTIENDWTMGDGGEDDKDLPDFVANFDELFRAEEILHVWTDEVPAEWPREPRVICWVKKAMGGAAFLPFVSKEIYFAPEGKMGGVGNLSTVLKGHDRVVAKQISLRQQHAVGWVRHSGFPQAEELTRAMTRVEYVCSVRFENGRPVLFEGYPSNPGEELLTDDGEGANADTMQALARGEGNDVLTLNERTAKLIGLSKGTVASQSELLSTLRFAPDQLVPSRSEVIMRDWKRGLENAKSQLLDLIREYSQVQVQGDWNQRKAARSTQLQKLEQIKGILRRWEEGLGRRWMYQNGIPSTAQLQEIQDRIRLAQQLDKK